MAGLVECRSPVNPLSKCDPISYSTFIVFIFKLTSNYTPDILPTSRTQKVDILSKSNNYIIF